MMAAVKTQKKRLPQAAFHNLFLNDISERLPAILEDGLAEPAYLQIPGYDQVLVLDWKSDNTGPPGCDRDTKQADDLAGNGTATCNLTAGVAQVTADYRTVRSLLQWAVGPFFGRILAHFRLW